MLLYREVKEGVKRNDIVICDINRLAIIDQIDEENKIVELTFIDNGFQCFVRLKQIRYVNHNTEKAACSYRSLIAKMKH